MRNFVSVGFLVILSFFSCTKEKSTLTVVAASNVKPALDSIASVYMQENPSVTIQLIYGSSGKLYEQILQDAPFDVFFSADTKYTDSLFQKNKTLYKPQVYAIGQLVLWSKKLDPNILKMQTLLNPEIQTIAIANPKTAPYGAKALESLAFFNLTDKVAPKLVYAENINQTSQFLHTGAVDVGIIALSIALSTNMKKENGFFYTIPNQSHSPIKQVCCVIKNSKNNLEATDFIDYTTTEKGIAILNHFGYLQHKK